MAADDRRLRGELSVEDYATFDATLARTPAGRRTRWGLWVIAPLIVGAICAILLGPALAGMGWLTGSIVADSVIAFVVGMLATLLVARLLPRSSTGPNLAAAAERGVLMVGPTSWRLTPEHLIQEGALMDLEAAYDAISAIDVADSLAAVYHEGRMAILIPLRSTDAAAFVDELRRRVAVARVDEPN